MGNLNRLFRPDSVAVIGGGAWCRSVIGALDRIGFEGPVWHVHPNAEGAIRSIADLPAAPDACFIGVNRTATIDCLRDLSAKGAGGAVCFASGFAETGDGAELNTALLSAAGDMAIVGPNCYGFVNALDKVALWPDVHGLIPVESGVAILTQSSNIALNLSMQRRGLPIAFVGTAGNQAQMGLSQIAQTLIQDPRITALGLHIEGVGDLKALQSLMQDAHLLGKPVIALKSGRSEAAQTAALSHTASLSGSDAGAGALFDRLGILRVRSLDALIEALKHAHLYGPTTPGAIASLSCSGGEASLMADGGDARGLTFAPLTKAQDCALEAVLGPLVTRANPLDYHTFIWNDAPKMAEVYAIMASGPAALTVIVVDFPRQDRCQTDAWDCVEEAAIMARQRTGKRIALLTSLSESLPEDMSARLMQAGILPLHGMDAALDALAGLYQPRQTTDTDRAIPQPASHTDTTMRDEAEAKAILALCGLDVPRHALATSSEEAGRLAEPMLPVVLKARGVAHKSDVGGVMLNLHSADAVRKAASAMPCDNYYMEEMISDGVVEILVGIVADPAHGYVLTLGAGGVLTELWRDTCHLLLPATKTEIGAALDGLRIAPLLHGYRSKPAGNRAALIAAIMSVQDYVVAQEGRVAEIEINPLIVTPTRAVVADALIREER
ncbi:acetate--CoA ligase family protein [Marivita cryptomonadis]|uniref:Acetate--CoA ligase family protein n=2 Tax=Roseobacteraceae TaxID=2854170 RepID=A0A9Q2S5C0_9RHOB|nr:MULTISPECIES: acetate--CoA ligase family protein [Marivita]MCR9170553.1 acetate--CoA ligase family protein [Paracoccaceae bacterium]MBM2322024.1 acetate--CoA ligase family protein [Marivita cryptomonadis]MBM2331605.1 acetate--CoA ligase family protein [Marivita cryptomonadis]MBM2341190.1 acetate--CoA ligase family protein [Marivita cryptomonadis]MBM2345853.1 acetate--CoA ligase family protein [Marivita cryptomonadis]